MSLLISFLAWLILLLLAILYFFPIAWQHWCVFSGTLLQIIGAIATGLFAYFGLDVIPGALKGGATVKKEKRGLVIDIDFIPTEISISKKLFSLGKWGVMYVVLGLVLVAIPPLTETYVSVEKAVITREGKELGAEGKKSENQALQLKNENGAIKEESR